MISTLLKCHTLCSILCGAMKPHVIKASWVESMAYLSRSLHKSSVQLLLSYTCHQLRLQVIQSVHAKLAVWDVCEANVLVDDAMNSFMFYSLCSGKLLVRKPDMSRTCMLLPSARN